MQSYVVSNPCRVQNTTHLSTSSRATRGSKGSDRVGDDLRACVRSNTGTPCPSLFFNPVAGLSRKKSIRSVAGLLSGLLSSLANLDSHSSQLTRGTFSREENTSNAVFHEMGLGCARCRYWALLVRKSMMARAAVSVEIQEMG